jgi:hypothetical protein
MSLTRIFQAHVVSDLPPLGGRVGDVEGRGNSASRCSRVRGAGSEPDYTAPSLGSTADD